MNISFLTTDEPIYLPSFFDRVLPALQSSHRARVYAAPPLYRNQSSLQAAIRYLKTFGPADTLRLVGRLLAAKGTGRSVATSCRKAHAVYARVSDVNQETFLDELRSHATELLVSVSCPQIFKKPLLEVSPKGTLNIHGALLPKYRGVMPSFWMMANGERQAGVSIYFVDEAVDAGDLCAQKAFEIHPRESLDVFLRRSKQVAAQLFLETMAGFERGEVSRQPLDLKAGSYHSWPTPEAVKRFRALGHRIWA